MTKEEAAKVLKLERDSLRENPKVKVDQCLYDAYDIALKALEQTRWIPVSKRLPEENKTVIASTTYGVYPEAKYTKKYGWEWAYEAGADYWRKLDYVIAWMPLPEEYKAESEEV